MAAGATAFAYDFNTLFDYVERQADLHVRLTFDSGDEKEPAGHFLIVVQEREKKADWENHVEPVSNADFDGAAARLAPRLQGRGILP